jgi:hypothetical protein
MAKHILYACTAALVATACTDPDATDFETGEVDALDPADGTITPPRTRAPGAHPEPDDRGMHAFPDGEVTYISVDTGAGIRQVPVVDVDGDLVTEGDIVVVPAERRGDRALVKYGDRWQSTTIPYEIDPAVNASMVEASLDHIEQRSPLRFVERTTEDDFLRYVPSPNPWSSSPVGRQGGGQNLKMQPGFSLRTGVHETLHSLGFKHEQKRPGRDSYVTVHEECIVDAQEEQYDIDSGYLALNVFDFASVMLYRSTDFCEEDDTGACICLPMEHTDHICDPPFCSDMDGDGWNEFVNGGQRLSPFDIDALFVMYGGGLGTNEPDDNLGRQIAVGDFDDDGYYDAAVSAPFEAPGSDPDAGIVFLYKGTFAGLTPWRWISQETTGVDIDGFPTSSLGMNNAGDQFGKALAVGDFDGDGIDDLAVGAPGEDIGAALNTGAVFVYRGNKADVVGSDGTDARHGLQPWKILTQATLGLSAQESNDLFGASLAAGDIDRVNDADGREEDLAIGAPGEAIEPNPAGGVVYLARGGSAGFTGWNMLFETTGIAAGERFGAAVVVADVDGDVDTDVIVGAPGETVTSQAEAGAVFVFRASGAATPAYWATLTETPFFAAGAGDELGTAIAAGDFNDDGRQDLAIGAPDRSGGRVLVFRGRATLPPLAFESISQAGLGENEAGDQFGMALATGELDGTGPDDLVVGAPGEELSDTINSGFVFVFHGAASGMDPVSKHSLAPLATPYSLDLLGSSVAVVPMSHYLAHVLVGAPGRTVEGFARSGAFMKLMRTSSAGLEPVTVWDQETLAKYHD